MHTIIKVKNCKYCENTGPSADQHACYVEFLPSYPIHEQQTHSIGGKLHQTHEEKVKVQISSQVGTLYGEAIVGHAHGHAVDRRNFTF